MNVYLDSSFLASLYTRDPHLPVAHRWLLKKPQVHLTPLNRAELAHAIYFQVFRQRFRVAQAQVAWEAFESDCSKGIWRKVPMPPGAWDLSATLAERHGPEVGIRTLDSLHVACALELGADKFWTFDERQARLADAVGLDTKP